MADKEALNLGRKKRRSTLGKKLGVLNMEQPMKTRVNNQMFFSAAVFSSRSAHIRQSSASIIRQSITDSIEKNVCRRVGLHQACKEGQIDVVKNLLRQGSSTINNLDDSGYAPLHYASRYERIQIAELLITHGADINVRTSDDLRMTTPLHLAAKFNSFGIVRMLMSHEADIDQRSLFGHHALHYAARRGSVHMVKLFLQDGGVSPNITDNENATPLHVACQSERLDIVDILLRYGGDPSQCDVEGCSPMHIAAREGRSDILRLLLDYARKMGASYCDILNMDGQNTNSCLHIAVQHGHVEAAKVCIEYGADVSEAQSDLCTPLHVACSRGDFEMTHLLVTHGADLNAEDAERMTPILRASLTGDVKIIDYLLNNGVEISPSPGSRAPSPLLCAVKRCHYQAVTHILQRGSPIELRDTSDRTALHIAVYSADAKTVSILLENGGKGLLNTKERDGKSPLHYAAAKGDIRIIRQLLEAGSQVDQKDDEERIPLHYAAENGNLCVVNALLDKQSSTIDDRDSRLSLTYAAAGGHVAVVKYLLDKGAEIDTRDYDRTTPLLYVAKVGCLRTAKVLLDQGAKINATDKNRFSALIMAAGCGRHELVTMLLDRGADMSIISNSGQNCLLAAIEAGHRSACMAIIKHERWEEACNINACDVNRSPMKCLIEKFPDVAKIVMDKCITRSEHQDSDEKLQITYNYKYLDPAPEKDTVLIGKKFFAPKAMLQNERRDLLFHPLTLELIRYKWSLFGLRFFYLGAILHLVYITVLTFYVQCQNERHIDRTWSNRTTTAIFDKVLCNQYTVDAAEVAILIISVFNLGIEFYQMYTEKWDYIETSNVVEFSTFTCALVALGIKYFTQEGDDLYLYWSFTIVLVLLAYLTMLLQFQSLFQNGIYVTMLFEVLKTLLRVMCVFLLLFYGYAVVFQLLLSKESNWMMTGHKPDYESIQTDPFQNVSSSFLKVLVMTIGEIEYTRFFVDEPLALPNLSRLVFLSFCLFLPIVLMNLTIGLAVGDIDSIQKNAEIKRLAIQIDSIYEFEEKLPCFVYCRFYKSETVKKPNEKPKTVLQKIKGRLSNRLLETTEGVLENSPERWSDVTDNLTNKMQAQEDRMELISQEMIKQRTMLERILEKIDKEPQQGDTVL
ncbi:transient receptor potential cation channel subfamily A member 1 [Nematostella vectensis]|uniref:transient receptor potential cation channel subfamily A member 1 n=1 Tax=Nematostella vectensis TaxID=45351 RepID=UPI0020779173|nr:transient receptor potential cation channel subfamily A member 1 [Nematostella vectensis]